MFYKKLIIITVIILVIIPSKLILSADFNRIGNSFRALAMGNTGISSAHDNESVFYNPASLPNIQRSFFDFVSFQLTSPLPITSIAKSIDSIISNDSDNILNIIDKSNKNSRLNFLLSSGFNYQIIDRGLNMNAYFAVEFDQLYSLFQNTTDTSANLKTRFDIIYGLGFSYPFGLGETVVAIGLKNVSRRMYEFNYGLDELTQNQTVTSRDDVDQKNAIGLDLGILYRMPGSARFRTSLSLLNTGGLNFNDTPEYDSPAELNFGVSIGPTFGHWRTIVAFDYRDILNDGAITANGEKDTSVIKRTHFGVELGYFVESKTFSLLNLRLGLNQGQLTYGAEMNFLFGRTIVLGYTSYKENIGDFDNDVIVSNNVIYISIGI